MPPARPCPTGEKGLAGDKLKIRGGTEVTVISEVAVLQCQGAGLFDPDLQRTDPSVAVAATDHQNGFQHVAGKDGHGHGCGQARGTRRLGTAEVTAVKAFEDHRTRLGPGFAGQAFTLGEALFAGGLGKTLMHAIVAGVQDQLAVFGNPDLAHLDGGVAECIKRRFHHAASCFISSRPYSYSLRNPMISAR